MDNYKGLIMHRLTPMDSCGDPDAMLKDYIASRLELTRIPKESHDA
jgi:hypothetical protein